MKTILAGAVSAILALSAAAEAKVLTYTFTAVRTTNAPDIDAGSAFSAIVFENQITGRLVYDTSVVGTERGDLFPGIFEFATGKVAFDYPLVDSSPVQDSAFSIQDVPGGQPFENLVFNDFFTDGFDLAVLRFRDETPDDSFISGSSLPALDLSLYTLAEVQFRHANAAFTDFSNTLFAITQLSQVPVPAAVLLFPAGLVALRFRGRKPA